MAARNTLRVSVGRQLFLAAAAIALLSGPFFTGIMTPGSLRAQSQAAATPTQPFAVASIKPTTTPTTPSRNTGFRRFTGGELNATNIPLRMLIAFAYDIPEDRVLQGPAWLDTERYEILAKPEQPDRSMDTLRVRTQMLMADRFQLVLHKDTRQLSIYKLVVDNGGPKNLQPPKNNTEDLVHNGHHLQCMAASMEYFAKVFLTQQLGAPVIDQTGIRGHFDFQMDWTPDEMSAKPSDEKSAVDPLGPSLLSALKEQLGLKLETGKGPVEVIIVDRAQKATAN